MIPRAHITAWRHHAPWPSDAQIEQDLVLSRALIEIFQKPLIFRKLSFRGGTALHKLFLASPGRYSEDIDLVQNEEGIIGPVLDEIREVIDPWLGTPKRNQSQGRVTLIYRFETTTRPLQRMRPGYRFDVSCQGSVPESIIAFLDSDSYEDAIKNAISLGGDADTMACIAGGIAQADYKEIPAPIIEGVRNGLPRDLLEVVDRFNNTYGCLY